ncbi:hypothetical protein J4402_05455 [Candidatus Pacearchaeota archaeon]|nr:hypothetical protein [Candidatus Pacearchaeota archaeon]
MAINLMNVRHREDPTLSGRAYFLSPRYVGRGTDGFDEGDILPAWFDNNLVRGEILMSREGVYAEVKHEGFVEGISETHTSRGTKARYRRVVQVLFSPLSEGFPRELSEVISANHYRQVSENDLFVKHFHNPIRNILGPSDPFS